MNNKIKLSVGIAKKFLALGIMLLAIAGGFFFSSTKTYAMCNDGTVTVGSTSSVSASVNGSTANVSISGYSPSVCERGYYTANGWASAKLINSNGAIIVVGYCNSIDTYPTFNITCNINLNGVTPGTYSVKANTHNYLPPAQGGGQIDGIAKYSNAFNVGTIQNPTVHITANPSTIQSRGSSDIVWTSSNATSCIGTGGAVGWAGPRALNSDFYITGLLNTTTFTITCYGASGTTPATDSVIVTVNQVNPTGNLTVSPSICVIPANGSTCTTGATWTTSNATSVALVDRNTGITLNTAPNRTTPLTVWVTYPYTTFDLKNNGVTLDTARANASCASQTNWNGSYCASVVVNQPSVNLTANPTSIQSGQSSNLNWTSQYATSCTSNWGNVRTSGIHHVYPTTTHTYTITCYGASGTTPATDSVTIYVNEVNNGVSVTLNADDRSIAYEDSTTVRWDSENADYCNRTGGSNGWTRNNVSTSGHFDTGDLTSDKTYRIVCYNDNDSASDSVTVSVGNNNNNDVSVDIRADDVDIISGDNTRVRWSSYDADYCTATNGVNGWSGSKDTSGTFNTGSLAHTTTYTITCRNYNNSNSDTDSVTVYVQNQQINYPPTVVLSADQSSLPYNGATTVRWYTTNATTCYASGGSNGWAGAKSIGPASFYTASLSSSKTFTLTCSNNYGTATDTKFIYVSAPINNNPIPPTSLVLINSSIDRNQPIVPTIDNTNPRPGDEINYTVSYQNIGTGSISNLVLQMNLPYEIDYISSNPNNPTFNGNALTFNLGTLKANGQGTVTVRVRVRDNIPAGTSLNFPATLSYVDPSGRAQSVNANVTAQVWTEPTPVPVENNNSSFLGANVFGAGFLPSNIFGWLLLIILALILIAVVAYFVRYIFGYQPLLKKTTTTTTNQPAGKKTTTTTEHQ